MVRMISTNLALDHEGSETSQSDQEMTTVLAGVSQAFKNPVIETNTPAAATKKRRVTKKAPSALNKSTRTAWHKDNILPGSRCSDQIVMSFMTDVTFYQKYKGGDPHCGATKMVLAMTIVKALESEGIHNRKAKDVCGRISKWESDFKKAVNFKNNTGEGLTTEANFKELMTKRCTYYYELEEVLSARPSVKPLITNADERCFKGDGILCFQPPTDTKLGVKELAGSVGLDKTVNMTIVPSKLSFTSPPPTSRIPSLPSTSKRIAGAKRRGSLIDEDQFTLMNARKKEQLLQDQKKLEVYQIEVHSQCDLNEVKKQESMAMADKIKLESLVFLMKSRQELKALGVSDDIIDAKLPL